jgi:tRNA-Thr(GGU) m(6)t(6)A37 methyltransferase TsaA
MQPGPDDDFTLRPIGWVQSTLTDLASAPKQAHEGAPQAWLTFAPAVLDGLDGLRVGDHVVVLTWLHRADRAVLAVHPRGNVANPLQGVFGTRSPARPNPIGLHEVKILEIDGARVRVDALEALDGTPVVDVKPVLRQG